MAPPPAVPYPGQPSLVFPIDFDDDKHDGKKKTYDVNNKIMVASIVSLSVVVVLVTVLHIYARWLLRRQARRRAALRRLGLLGTANYTEPPPKTGLDPAVIASMPTFVFRQPVPDAETATTVSECAVCLSVLEDEEVVKVLPNCNHSFHVECIDKWFVSHTTCPICRAEAQPVNQADQPTAMPVVQSPTAPPMIERTGSISSLCMEGTSSDGAAPSIHRHKRSGSITSLGSFKRILSKERSSRRIQPEEANTRDLERQQ